VQGFRTLERGSGAEGDAKRLGRLDVDRPAGQEGGQRIGQNGQDSYEVRPPARWPNRQLLPRRPAAALVILRPTGQDAPAERVTLVAG
jgi:hypothetical protein